MWNVKYMIMLAITAAIRNGNKRCEETFGNRRGKAFSKFTKRDSYTRNIIHNTERTCGLKLEHWAVGSPSVQDKCRERKVCDKTEINNNNNHNILFEPNNLLSSSVMWLLCFKPFTRLIMPNYTTVEGSLLKGLFILIIQRDATQSILFITLQVHSSCCGCQPHPSSGIH